jgi:hypothetical protein
MNCQNVYLVHALPGRIRLKMEALKGNHSLAKEVQERLALIKEAQQVQINPTTGSILVLFTPHSSNSADFQMQIANALGISLTNVSGKKGKLGIPGNGCIPRSPANLMNKVFGTLNSAVFSSTGGVGDLRILLPAGLFVLGLRSLFMTDKVSFPLWYDFLWFAFGSYFMLNRNSHSEGERKP